MRILIVGPAAEGSVMVAVGERSLPLLQALHLFDGPHDLFPCTELEQAIRYLSGLSFDLVVAGGEVGRRVIRWADENVSALPKAPRCYAYDRDATAVLYNLTLREGPPSVDIVRELVTRRRIATGKYVDAETLLRLKGYGDQARGVIDTARSRIGALNDLKRQDGEAALGALGFNPAVIDLSIDEQTGEVIEIR